MSRERYAETRSVRFTADGGSNGSRVRLWEIVQQKLADEPGVSITVCRLLSGASDWNKIEHRLFLFITTNWRGYPLARRNTYSPSIMFSDGKVDAVQPHPPRLSWRVELHCQPQKPSSWSDSSRTGGPKDPEKRA
jgi:hypothetical protein